MWFSFSTAGTVGYFDTWYTRFQWTIEAVPPHLAFISFRVFNSDLYKKNPVVSFRELTILTHEG